MFTIYLSKELLMDYQNYQDQMLQCVECGQEFTFTGEDQEFYAQKGYSSPKRCPVCRANRKNASRGNSRGGGGGYNRPQYTVICSACGCETTVPFEPRGDKPVYCSDCYRNMKNG